MKNLLPRFLSYANRVIKALEREDKEDMTTTGMVLYGRTKVTFGSDINNKNVQMFWVCAELLTL